MKEFEKELGSLINKHSIENECDIPDFLLASMICNYIRYVSSITKEVLDWHGCDSVCHPNQSKEAVKLSNNIPNGLRNPKSIIVNPSKKGV